MLLAAALVAAAARMPARAEPRNGDDLLQYCTATIGAYMLYCFGYIEAVADILVDRGVIAGFDACLPVAIDDVQLRDRIVKHLKNNPATRREPAAALVARALHDAFPCRLP